MDIEEGSFFIEYDALPEGIKIAYSFKEYGSMTDQQRATLVDNEVEPEWEEP